MKENWLLIKNIVRYFDNYAAVYYYISSKANNSELHKRGGCNISGKTG